MTAILCGSREQVLMLAGANPSTFRSHRMQGFTVGAFGVADPVHWLAIDGIAMNVRDDLLRSGMPMRAAVTTVLAFWPEYLDSVGEPPFGRRRSSSTRACLEFARVR
jgi:hypothetical protein